MLGTLATGACIPLAALSVLRYNYYYEKLGFQAFIDHYPVQEFIPSAPQQLYGRTRLLQLPSFVARFDCHLWCDGQWPPCEPPAPRTLLSCVSGSLSNASVVRRGLLEAADAREAAKAIAAAVGPGDEGPSALVIQGGWAHLSEVLGDNDEERAATTARLVSAFGSVSAGGYDFKRPGIRAFPIGLAESYMRRTWRSAKAAIESASLEPASKPRGVLAGLSTTHYFYKAMMELKQQYSLPVESKTSDVIPLLTDWQGQPVHYATVVAARYVMHNWLQGGGPEANGISVDYRTVDKSQWWSELAKYRFLMSPLGDYIQTAKTTEALLVLTVPVVERGPYIVHDELVNLGFPIVVVERWSEMTIERLEEWWEALSPRLESFRRKCLTSEAYWQMAIGELSHCA